MTNSGKEQDKLKQELRHRRSRNLPVVDGKVLRDRCAIGEQRRECAKFHPSINLRAGLGNRLSVHAQSQSHWTRFGVVEERMCLPRHKYVSCLYHNEEKDISTLRWSRGARFLTNESPMWSMIILPVGCPGGILMMVLEHSISSVAGCFNVERGRSNVTTRGLMARQHSGRRQKDLTRQSKSAWIQPRLQLLRRLPQPRREQAVSRRALNKDSTAALRRWREQMPEQTSPERVAHAWGCILPIRPSGRVHCRCQRPHNVLH